MVEDVEKGISVFCRHLLFSLSILAKGRRRGICNVANKSMAPLQIIIAELEVKLSVATPNKACRSTTD